MKTDKETKKEFKIEASRNPDKYYATAVLKREGFMRKQCACGTFFWTVNKDQDHCGDPACSGGFRFIGKTPAKKEMDYITVWKEFSALFKRLGYTPIARYPVVARWRDDTDFVQASIYDFQPFVVSGEVKPPANPLVVPQFCLRFNDIDNVGITGAHYTGFVMIGQHMFVPPEEWDQNRVFSDIHTWLKEGLGLPNSEITFHEDAWAGGGNFGPCMEYFSRGLELGNQVYMLFEQTPQGPKSLKLKVLDMGMGHERNAWFTKGTSTSYESTFPTVMEKLRKITGVKVDNLLMQKFLPVSSFLNIDEVESIEAAWKRVADTVGVDVEELKSKIIPLSALYSVAEHSRSLLFALSDGALPSNVGGGYNLRIILRRALSFIDQYGWDIRLPEVCRWHAEYLEPLFPELMTNLDQVEKILDVEKEKYLATKEKSKAIVARIVQGEVTTEKLISLYDSHGIDPETIRREAGLLGTTVKVPEDFYTQVAALHEKRSQVHATEREEKLDIPSSLPGTEIRYYDDYLKLTDTSEVIWMQGKKVILDSSIIYPTSGGQIHDTGSVGGIAFTDAYKQGAHIIIELEREPGFKTGFKTGETVKVMVDEERRRQLAQHHTATHIVNACAREILGNHINQAGAKKTLEKAHLDVTHYQNISDEELREIEERANAIVSSGIKVESEVLARGDAEGRYGMSIYQGGAVPGKNIRVVSVKGLDVEACGGTHLHNTREVGQIKILKAKKIQDGIVRITFTAGNATLHETGEEEGALRDVADILDCEPSQVPGRVKELFSKWKEAKKAQKKGKEAEESIFSLSSEEEFEGEALSEAARILQTQPEHVAKTVKRFLSELEGMKRKTDG